MTTEQLCKRVQLLISTEMNHSQTKFAADEISFQTHRDKMDELLDLTGVVRDFFGMHEVLLEKAIGQV